MEFADYCSQQRYSIEPISLSMAKVQKSYEEEREGNGETIEIPLKSGDEVIELDVDQLPDCEEVLNILNQELAPLKVWINVALGYYKKKIFEGFRKILEEAQQNLNELKPYENEDYVRLYDYLAHFYGFKASNLITKAKTLFTATDGIALYDQNHLLGRAFHFIYEGENWNQADSQLNFVINQNANCVPAYLGKACIAFNKKEYKNALGFYRRALRLQPNCPPSVRVGIGHCFFKLNNIYKARMAFNRALELDPNSVGALIGLAVLDLNERTQESIKQGVQKLSKAYNLDQTNPMVLNHLADHFFYKKEYDKVNRLAMHAFCNTDNEPMRAESCYQLARAYHVENNFDKAFQYYYLATQFASSNFLLPFYGLGQMYLHRNDLEHAAQAFEKVLKEHPKNYETLKILGRLYGQSNNPEKLKQARNLFKQVTEIQPDDVEAWIEYGQLLENDIQGSLDAYLKALKLLADFNLEISPELYNNIGVLYFMQKDYDNAGLYFFNALKRIKEDFREIESENDDLTTQDDEELNQYSTCSKILTIRNQSTGEDYLHGLSVTVNYNRGRLFESIGRTDLAEEIYRLILVNHPTYIDCFLRFGCIARDRGLIRNASVWFNEALEIKPENADARSLIAMLHFSKGELEQAQKKFETIVRQPEFRADPYSRIALGNIWLNSLHHSTRDKDRKRRHQERALSCYKAVLAADPKNIWAAHGIGCILAHKLYLNEARDVFAQVREATANFPDVWISIAHIYVEQKQYTAAIQMYENCLTKFNRLMDTDILLYLARANFKAGNLKECKKIILKARHIKPWDPLLIYNLALVQKRLAVCALQDESSSFYAVYEAIADLSMSRCTFVHLTKMTELPYHTLADDEARTCQDLLSQAKYHLNRAKSREEQDRVVKQRQDLEREAERRRQTELNAQIEAMRQEREKKLEEEREKFVLKAKELAKEGAFTVNEEKKGSGRKRGAGRNSEFINDGNLYSDDEGGGDGKSKKKSKKKKFEKSNDDGLTKQQRNRIVSKAVISSSDDENNSSDDDDLDDDEPTKQQKANLIAFNDSSSNDGEGELKKAKMTTKKKKKNEKPRLDDDDDDNEVSDLNDDDDESRRRRKRKRKAHLDTPKDSDEDDSEKETKRMHLRNILQDSDKSEDENMEPVAKNTSDAVDEPVLSKNLFDSDDEDFKIQELKRNSSILQDSDDEDDDNPNASKSSGEDD